MASSGISRELLPICLLVALTVAAISAIVGGLEDVSDVEIALSLGALAAVCALPLLLCATGGMVRLDHPSAIMAIVVAFYWLTGILTRTASPGAYCPHLESYFAPAALALASSPYWRSTLALGCLPRALPRETRSP